MKYIIFLSFLFFIPVSQAEIQFEPYGNIGASYSSVSSRPVFMTYVLGGRVGYSLASLSVGLDLFWTHHNIGGNSSSQHHLEVFHQSSTVKGFGQAADSVSFQYSEVSRPFEPFSMGVFGALELPFLFDVYGTFFYTFGEKKSVNHHGIGAKAGASYLIAFYVKLNVELQYAYYKCIELAKCSQNFGIFSAMFSLSLPLSSDIFDFGVGSSEDPGDSEGSAEEVIM